MFPPISYVLDARVLAHGFDALLHLVEVLQHELLGIQPSIPSEYFGELGGGHSFHLEQLSAPVRS